MQNKANFQNGPMYLSAALSSDYEGFCVCAVGENKAKTKPILRIRSGQAFFRSGQVWQD